MIEWWGPILHEYYAGTEGNGFVYMQLARTGWPTRARSARRSLGEIHIVGDDGEELPDRRAGHDLLRGRRPSSSTTTTRRRRPRRATRTGWRTLGDVGYARRGRLPLPHRPQGVHDHLGRREHLPAGGREPARHAPEGGRRRRLRRAQRGLRRGGQGGRAAGRRCADAGARARARADRVLPRTPGRRRSARARSTSATSCPATRPASSTSGC